MVISGIYLTNFKSFKGHHQIEGLSSSLTAEENVVLIGGLNGAGKTTFLESLYLCLYGSGANKLYPTRGAKFENYHSFIGALLNNDIKQSGQNVGKMCVELFLDDVPLTGNFPKNISLRRTWNFELLEGRIVREPLEEFDILENGQLVEELDRSEYQDRVNMLLPYDVAQLFLFDGEKIQDFAGDPESEFSNALKKVLGISLYSTLSEDIKQVRSRILTDYNKNKQAAESLAKMNLDRQHKEGEIQDNGIEIAEINNQLDELQIDLEKIENETYRVTRIETKDRTDFERQRTELERERMTLESEYVNDATDYLPFLLPNSLCDEVLQQLSNEEKLLSWQAAQREIEPKIDQIVNFVFTPEINTKETLLLNSLQKRFYGVRLDQSIRDTFFNAQDNEVTGVQFIHGLSASEVDKVRDFFDSVSHRIIDSLALKSSRLKNIDYTLNKIRNTQSYAGDNNDEIKRLFDKKGEIERSVGALIERRDKLIFANDELRRQIESIKSQISKWEERTQVSDEQRRQITYCEQANTVIQDFQRRFQAKRTADLEVAIQGMWNALAHKDKLVKRVQVMPEQNFSVDLYDRRGSKLDKTKLSAGEKEIYAISLLWALVQVSGRRMPIIVDTPFGRLDSLHRSNIVKKYFPKASHQVILLSQDEEIVNKYYQLIKPFVALELTIENADGESLVRAGYPFAEVEVA
ncbi:DNA sulfur modification protein DndD [Spirosoma arcticum]